MKKKRQKRFVELMESGLENTFNELITREEAEKVPDPFGDFLKSQGINVIDVTKYKEDKDK